MSDALNQLLASLSQSVSQIANKTPTPTSNTPVLPNASNPGGGRLLDNTSLLLSKNSFAPLQLDIPSDLQAVMNKISIPAAPERSEQDTRVVTKNHRVFQFSDARNVTVKNTVTYNPIEHKSIQELIDKSESGTKIILPMGTYNEYLKIPEIDLIMEGQGSVELSGLESSASVLLIDNVSFKQKDGLKGGISILQGSVKIQDSSISANKQSALLLSGKALGHFTNCLIFAANHPCLFTSEESSACCTDCTIGNSSFLGCLLTDQSQVQIVESTICGNQQGGILVSGTSSLTLEKSTLKNNEKKQIEVVSRGVIFVQETLFENSKSGPAFYITGGTEASISKCTFQECSSTAIQASNAASVDSKYNVFRDSIDSLIIMLTNTASFTSEGDELTGKMQAGITCIDGGQAFVKSLNAHDTTGSALYSTGQNSLLCCDDSVIDNIADISVEATNSSRMELCNVKIKHSTDVGFMIMGNATGTFDNVIVSDGNTIGGSVQQTSEFRFKNCTFTNNGNCGVLISESNPTFETCKFTKNGLYAGEIKNASPRFNYCNISDHTDCGLNIHHASSPVITGGSITDIQRSGIVVDTSSPYIRNMTIANNGSVGITALAGSKPVIEYCTIKRNMKMGIQISDKETFAKLNHVLFDDHPQSCALGCLSGGSAICNSCMFRKSQKGHVEIREESAVALIKCDMAECISGISLQVHNNGYLHMIQSVVHDEEKVGLYVGEKGNAEVIACTFKNIPQVTLLTLDNSKTIIKNCLFDGTNAKFGLQSTGGNVDVSNTTFKNYVAAIIKDKSKVTFSESGNQYIDNQVNVQDLSS